MCTDKSSQSLYKGHLYTAEALFIQMASRDNNDFEIH